MMLKKIFALACLAIFAVACSKKTDDTPPATVPEQLTINEASGSINVAANFTFTLKYFNTVGQQTTPPANIVWSSTNTAVATVNQQGIATGVSAGQTQIKAVYNNITATALLTVVTNNMQLATIVLNPATLLELKLNEASTIIAEGKNSVGGTVSGLTFTWQSDNAALAEMSGNGTATGKNYGTANVTASANGIQSAPVMIQVLRKADFSLMASAGTAKLKIENAILKLQTTANFSVAAGPPDLRIYLGNNANNITGALEVASLNQRTGSQSWNIAAGNTITQYRYVIVWCKQFGGVYGLADLGL
jgi:hypothetical protein